MIGARCRTRDRVMAWSLWWVYVVVSESSPSSDMMCTA